MRLFSLVLALLSAVPVFANEIPSGLSVGRIGSLAPTDHFEPQINLPVDYEEVCLRPRARYELAAWSNSVEVMVFVHDVRLPVSRHGATFLAHSRAVSSLTGQGIYYNPTLQFKVPATANGGCRKMLIAVGVEVSSPNFFGNYSVRLRRI